MVECFSISEEKAQFFRELLGVEFDFAKRGYFLAAYTTDWEATRRGSGYMSLFPPPRKLPTFAVCNLKPETQHIG